MTSCNSPSSWVANLLDYTIVSDADVHHLMDSEFLPLSISPSSLWCEAVSFFWLSNTEGLVTHFVLDHHSCECRQRPWAAPEVSIRRDSGMICLSWVIKVIINLYPKYRKLLPNLTYELPDVQAGFRKGRGTRDQIADIHWIIEKAREFQKNIYFALLTIPKPFCGSQQTGKFLKIWAYQITLPDSCETSMEVKKQQLQPDMENGLVQNWERSTPKLYLYKATLLI